MSRLGDMANPDSPNYDPASGKKKLQPGSHPDQNINSGGSSGGGILDLFGCFSRLVLGVAAAVAALIWGAS